MRLFETHLTRAARRAARVYGKNRRITTIRVARQSTTTSNVDTAPKTPMIKGTTPNSHRIDLSTVRIGQRLEIPYEMTVTATWRENWQSIFYQTDRMYTSTQYTTALGFGTGGRIPMPFGMMLYLTGSMSHVDDTRDVYELSFSNAVYETPVFAGDTLRRNFTIDDAFESTDGENVILNVHCESVNQYDQRVFSFNKMMYFRKLQRGLAGNRPRGPVRPKRESRLRQFLIDKQGRLPQSTSFLQASPRRLLLHASSRPIGTSASMGLSTQHRMTHPALFNTNRYDDDQLLVAGPCLISAAHAVAGKIFYETLYEEIREATMVNRVNPNECIGAMTYVKSVTPVSDRLEEVECTTVGLKNVDVDREMQDMEVPLELFTRYASKPSDVNDLVMEACPFLVGKVVLVSHRVLLRQSVSLGGALL